MEIIIPTQELNDEQCQTLLNKLEDNNVDYFIDNLIDFTECGENPDICLDTKENADKVKDIIRDIKKGKPKLLKIKTRKTNLYRGDKTIQIQAIMENGTIGLMNLTPIYFNRKKQYENDVNGYIFETITKAKQYCLKHITQLTGI